MIDYVIGWDNVTFPIPGKISRIASNIINQRILNNNLQGNIPDKIYLNILIGGHDSIIKLVTKNGKNYSYEIRINVKRNFCESVEIEGDKLGNDIVSKLELAIKSILLECKI